MALQTSGQISLNDMHIEAGGSSGTEVSLNDSDIRDLVSASSGSEMSFDDWYGATAETVMTSAGTVNGQPQRKQISASSFISAGGTLRIPSNMWVWSDSTGTPALTVDVANAVIINEGKIIGKGGNGATAGASGGPALRVTASGVTIQNQSGAYIAGGGGGGAGWSGQGSGGGAGGGAGGGGAGGGSLNAKGSNGSPGAAYQGANFFQYVWFQADRGDGGGAGGGAGATLQQVNHQGFSTRYSRGSGGGGGRQLPGSGGAGGANGQSDYPRYSLSGGGGSGGSGGGGGGHGNTGSFAYSSGGGGGWGASGGRGRNWNGAITGPGAGGGGKAISKTTSYTLNNSGTIYGGT